MSDQIDQAARRKPGFTEGGSAELGDGRRWAFPRLRVCLTPKKSDGGAFGVALSRAAAGSALPRFEGWFRALTTPGTPNDEFWGARMDAAATMLALNYDLADDELAALLAWHEGDADSDRRWGQIDLAVLGLSDPKATPAT